MRSNPIAYGEPVFFKGKYKEDKLYNLYVQQIVCRFKLKKNKIPTIQIKSKGSLFIPTEYLTDSGPEPVPLVLTSIDLKLFLEQYDVSDLEYIAGWKFKSVKGLFTEYIDKWTKEKIEAGKEGNKGKRTLAKLMLNSLYGKLATCLNATPKVPYILEDGIVRYKLGDPETKKGIYIPAAAFITAYAREKTIRTAQAITDYSIKKYGKDLFIYSDTDSIHTLLPIEELTQFCEIDDYELGYWAHEASFDKAVFIRSKCYAEYIKDKLKITCAGMTPACYPYVTFKNFRKGLTVPGKLTYSHIKGGVLLVPTDFTIKF